GATSSEAGIYLIGSSATYPVVDVKVAGNVINGGALDMIKVNATVAHAIASISITGNKLYGPNSANNGITFVAVDNGEVRGNDIYKAYAHGISVDSSSSNISIGDNNIYFPNQ